MARFAAKTYIEPMGPHRSPHAEGPCWLWVGRRVGGYGAVTVEGRVKRATHVALEIAKVVVPKGMHALHRCDNPQCVNPDHLFLGTQIDNMRDKVRKGRSRVATGADHGSHTKPESRPWGARNGMTSFTENDVREIRRRRAEGEPLKSLAAAFRCTQGTISHIANRKTWAHVA